MNLKMRLDSLETLLHLSGGDESAGEFKPFRRRIEKLGQERHEIIHGLWVRGDYGSPMISQVRARGALEESRAGRPAFAMRALADKIAEAAFELQEKY